PVATIPVGSNPAAVAVSPDGKKAYIANVDSNTVSVLDLSSNSIAVSIPVPLFSGASMVMSPDGARLYVAAPQTINSSAITVISTGTSSVVGSIAGDFSASAVPAIIFSSDGTRAYATELSSIMAIDVASSRVTGRVKLNGPRRIALSADGRRAYATSSAA